MTSGVSNRRRASSPVFVFETEHDPWVLAKRVGIGIDSTKDFKAGFETDDQLVAALFTAADGECYAFDIVVAPEHQGSGLGSKLMDLAIADYEELREPFPDMRFCLDAVNPQAVSMLQARGFEVERTLGDHTYLTRRGQRTVPRDEVLAALEVAEQTGKQHARWEQQMEHWRGSLPDEDFVLVDVPVAALDISGYSEERAQLYAEREGSLPPILAYYNERSGRIGKETLYVPNGNHRARAAEIRGEPTIAAYVPVSHWDRWRTRGRTAGLIDRLQHKYKGFEREISLMNAAFADASVARRYLPWMATQVARRGAAREAVEDAVLQLARSAPEQDVNSFESLEALQTWLSSRRSATIEVTASVPLATPIMGVTGHQCPHCGVQLREKSGSRRAGDHFACNACNGEFHFDAEEVRAERRKQVEEFFGRAASDDTPPALYHGTCAGSAKVFLEKGWQPNSGPRGSNMGQPRYLYVSTGVEDAAWFAEEKGCDTVVQITGVPWSALRPDPEDAMDSNRPAKEEVAAAMRLRLPAKLVITQPVDAAQFQVVRGKTASIEVKASDDPPVKRMMWRGMPVSIEVEGGNVRYPNQEFETWIPESWAGYGYFDDVLAEDGDSLDVIWGPEEDAESGSVFVAAQSTPEGEFTQFKVMVHFADLASAEAGFKMLWPESMFIGIEEVPADVFVTAVLPKLEVTTADSRTAQAAVLSVPATFLDGWEYGYGDWQRLQKLPLDDRIAWAETQRPKLDVPIDVRVAKDGTMMFNDGHHRAFAARTLNVPVKINVERNDMHPDIWMEFLDRVQRGYTKREINPEGYNLNKIGVPSIEALEAGREAGLRGFALTELYQKIDHPQDIPDALDGLEVTDENTREGAMDGFDLFDVEVGDDDVERLPDFKRGDQFRVDGKGPVWEVTLAQGGGGEVRRTTQKKVFGYLRSGEDVWIYPVDGTGARTGPDLVAGKIVLAKEASRAV